jgi:hypothetical protein
MWQDYQFSALAASICCLATDPRRRRACSQWLADRGYAVHSLNCRGSTGFGKALGACEPVGRDFNGSSHEFRAGAEIPPVPI